jgi:hypothetical protein
MQPLLIISDDPPPELATWSHQATGSYRGIASDADEGAAPSVNADKHKTKNLTVNSLFVDTLAARHVHTILCLFKLRHLAHRLGVRSIALSRRGRKLTRTLNRASRSGRFGVARRYRRFHLGFRGYLHSTPSVHRHALSHELIRGDGIPNRIADGSSCDIGLAAVGEIALLRARGHHLTLGFGHFHIRRILHDWHISVIALTASKDEQGRKRQRQRNNTKLHKIP